MAKKREGGGSNLGLIITLVFFVLSTVILGVTTYMGFSDIEKKEKEKKDAETKAAQSEKDYKWQRFQVRALRAWIGHPIPKIEDELVKEKTDFDAGSLPYADKQTDRDDVTKLFAKLHEQMAWAGKADLLTSTTYEKRIADLAAELARERDKLTKEDLKVKAAQNEKKMVEDTKDAEIAELKKTHADAEQRIRKDVEANYYQKALADIRKGLVKETDIMVGLRTSLEGMTKERDKLQKEKKNLENKLVQNTNEMRTLRDQKDDLQTRLQSVVDRTGVDLRAMEAATLDTQATKLLHEWRKEWAIVQLAKGGKAYINIGSADGLSTESQVTFSVHGLASDRRRLNPAVKGTLELERVIGPNLSLARVTSQKDAAKDPIIQGDRLFNPTWDPTRRKQVAIAGFADLGGDNADNNEDLRRLLKRQGVDVVAYIDTKDPKEPKVVGPGVSTKTDFLILGEGLEVSNHPKAREKAYAQAYDRKIRELKDKATTNGVTVLTLRRYLDMIGYRMPRVSIPGGAGASPP